MELLIQIFIGLIAFIHLYIVWFEMFAWEKRGPKVFKNFPPDLFPKTKALAGNQGLYNGFLAAGLIWSLCIENAIWQSNVSLFFLGCVSVAGIYGAATADRKILIIQTVPSVITIILILVERCG